MDGFIAGPNDEFDDYEPGDDEMTFAIELFGAMDGILFGRKTYQGFVEYWDAVDPADTTVSENDQTFARIFKNLKRVVFSRTLNAVDRKAVLINDHIAEEVTKLKEQPGKPFLLICGPELLATLVQLELVDEYHILIKPSALGRGKSLFGGIPEKLPLKLLGTRVFQSGAVLHHYQTA